VHHKLHTPKRTHAQDPSKLQIAKFGSVGAIERLVALLHLLIDERLEWTEYRGECVAVARVAHEGLVSGGLDGGRGRLRLEQRPLAEELTRGEGRNLERPAAHALDATVEEYARHTRLDDEEGVVLVALRDATAAGGNDLLLQLVEKVTLLVVRQLVEEFDVFDLDPLEYLALEVLVDDFL
jgi:hypothetical protein